MGNAEWAIVPLAQHQLSFFPRYPAVQYSVPDSTLTIHLQFTPEIKMYVQYTVCCVVP